MATHTQTGDERTVGQLVADATHDISGIIRSEVALAKAEVRSGARVMGKGAGLLGAAAVLGILAVIFLFHTLAQVIAIWLPVWAGYAITTALLLVVAAVLALVGKQVLTRAKPVPEAAIAEAKATIAVVKASH